MKIVVLSGKGGTGKSCVTSSIAIQLDSCILVDADVDCPNQFILFKGNEILRKKFSVSKYAVIGINKPQQKNYEKICEFKAIKKTEGKLNILETRCEGCGACSLAFPELNITLVPRNSCEIAVIETEKFPLVYGKLEPGQAGSGKVVFEIKRIADEIATKRGIQNMLVDAPAGIGCPVIAAVTGCQYAIGVVEPTPASIANLERALEVVDHFSIPYNIIVNKKGMSQKHEKEIEEKFGNLIIAEIPYDEEIPRMLAEGIPPSLGKCRGSEALIKMASKVACFISQKKD